MTNNYWSTGILAITLLSSFFMLKSILSIMERTDEPSPASIAQTEEDVKVQKVMHFLAQSDL